MEKYRICGVDASRKFIQASVRGEVEEVPVCSNCYQRYEPRTSKRGIEFKEARRISHTGYIFWSIESARAARIIEKIGRTFIGRIVSSLSIVSIPLMLLSIAIVVSAIGDRLLRPNLYFKLATATPKGYLTTFIPGLDPAIPLIQGLIAIFIAVTVHEFAHGLASTYCFNTPPRRVGLAFLLVFPIAGYVKIDMDPYRSGSWRFIGAGTAVNIATAILALILFAMQGIPELYIRYPQLLLLPPDYLRYLGVDINIGFIQSLLLYIWLINLWGAVFNTLPIPGFDGYWIYSSLLSRVVGQLIEEESGRRLGFRLSLYSGFIILTAMAMILLIERVILPYL